MEIHARAAAGFSRTAGDYERGRPGYPPALVEHLRGELGLRAGRSVLDLAAGTGKLTRLLVGTGAEVVAVEPVAEMRAELERAVPGVRALAGTAESIPLADGSVDAVTVAQAFHWFDGSRALPELHRVLRPGGRLAVVWNAWDDSSGGWSARVTALVARSAGDTPQYASSRWREPFESTELFTPLELRSFPHPQEVDAETLLARVGSISFVGALEPAARAEFLAEVRAALPREEPLRFAYRTDVFLCDRL